MEKFQELIKLPNQTIKLIKVNNAGYYGCYLRILFLGKFQCEIPLPERNFESFMDYETMNKIVFSGDGPSYKTIKRWIREKDFPCYKIGNRYFFRGTEVFYFIRANEEFIRRAWKEKFEVFSSNYSERLNKSYLNKYDEHLEIKIPKEIKKLEKDGHKREMMLYKQRILGINDKTKDVDLKKFEKKMCFELNEMKINDLNDINELKDYETMNKIVFLGNGPSFKTIKRWIRENIFPCYIIKNRKRYLFDIWETFDFINIINHRAE